MSATNTHIPQRYVYAGMLLCIVNMAALLWIPALLGALAQGFGLATSDLSKLASAELVGFLLGTMFTSVKSLPELKRWMFVGFALVIGANVALAMFAGQVPFIVLRPLAGLGGGVTFGYALKVCTGSKSPTQNFGILTGCMSLMMIVGFQLIAYLINTQATVAGVINPESVKTVAKIVFAVYAGFAVFAAFIYVTNQPPNTPQTAEQTAQQGQTRPSGFPEPIVIIGLAAILLSFMGQGSIWAFLQTLGIAHGFSVGGVANAMSAWAILGVIGSFSVGLLPARVPRWVAIGVMTVILYAGIYALYAPQDISWYVFGCAVGGFYWNFLLPLVLGLLAQVDASGRGSVLGGTMSSLGAAIGPLLAGLLIQGTNYQPVGWMAAGLSLAGLICVFVVEQRAKVKHI